ncbi:MAG: hypothetical protein IJ645_05570 [Ruminococcus sp.]|nr:hypothetical protein [Ruminococcus sp.]
MLGIKKQVNLRFSTCGEIMIDGLPFSFGVESSGKASKKGLCVSISGEDVDNGKITFSGLTRNCYVKGKLQPVRYDFKLTTKKDGKRIYMARFPDLEIPDALDTKMFKKVTEQDVLNRMNNEISFKVTPHYSGEDTPEILLTVYPLENVLTGSAAAWLKVTSDTDYFLHKLNKRRK